MTTTEDMFGPGGLYHRFTMGALIAASGDRIPVPICNDCGAVVIDVEAHRTACPRIMPPKPEPITPDRHEWAKIVHGHRGKPINDMPDAPVRCICGSFIGAPFGHSQHVAAMIANHVEATR